MFDIITTRLSAKKRINLLYVSVFLIRVAEMMVMIFVPVYLYSLGYTISLIIVFYLINSFSFVLFSIVSARLVSKIGTKHSILFSAIFFIAYYLLLNYIQSFWVVFLILPVLLSLKMIFYNYGYHLTYLNYSNILRRGRELSVIGILEVLAAALSPFLAGLIIAHFSFSVFFIFGAVLLVVGTLILFLAKEIYEPLNIDIKKSLKYFFAKKNRKNFLSFSGYAIESSINRIIWPIYLIILFTSFDKFGFVVSLSIIISILAFYFIGHLTDKYNRYKLLKYATFFFFFGWLARIFVDSALKVVAVDSFKNIAEKFVHIPWAAISYDLASQEKYFMFIVTREIMFNLSRVVILPFIALIFYLDFYPFVISFILAACLSLLYPVLNRVK